MSCYTEPVPTTSLAYKPFGSHLNYVLAARSLQKSVENLVNCACNRHVSAIDGRPAAHTACNCLANVGAAYDRVSKLGTEVPS